MLDNTTKKRIDDCRDILVGKLPDPKAQIEQITIGLIYKFMDDMDKEAIELGGKAKFFSGDYEKYSWDALFDTKVTAVEMLKLYTESIESMEKNPNIPQLFRDIFKNAYLPYRDPQTLKLFLKTIGEFEYTHSEKLGDAFEYLLSVMGSQGDAGQFRTPRHIIDFLVEVVNPSKTDTILDPACGTAGFLISAFKHIKEQNKKGLTPDESKKLIQNFVGYDISPDMVRLSLVNLYLHGFSDPHIWEYDTLSSEERWNESFDTILANPPFMSPKGGIRPHKKFTIKSNRSEVLFVDYIAEHLNPKGKAGIIVPEGVIFQSGTAYKDLRKMLVDNYLYAVVSLPAGVFNPYSGVKTSILLMDKEVSKTKNEILFVKIDNDGFNLGAQRTARKGSQLQDAKDIIFQFRNGEITDNPIAHAVLKSEIGSKGEYNLSGERYRNTGTADSIYEFVELKELCDLQNGFAFKSKDYIEFSNTLNVRMSNIRPNSGFDIDYNPKYLPDSYASKYDEFLLNDGDVIIAMTDMANDPKILGVPTIIKKNNKTLLLNQRVGRFRKIDESRLAVPFLKNILNHSSVREYYKKLGGGGLQVNISKQDVLGIKIPIPPLAVQEEIVAEIESYQKIIDGAKMIVENYKPKIDIDPDWEMVELEKLLSEDKYSMKAGPFGSSLKKEFYVEKGYKIYGQEQVIADDLTIGDYYIDEKKFQKLKSCEVKKDDLLISLVGTIGKVTIVPEIFEKGIINPRLIKISLDINKMTPKYFKYYFQSETIVNQVKQNAGGGTMPVLNGRILKALVFALPPLKIQNKIVAQIEKEQELVKANKQMIEIFEQKIKDRIAKVWGEDKKEEELSMAAEPETEYKKN